jgi:hypothetical protein
MYETGVILLITDYSDSKGVERGSSDLAAGTRSTRKLLCLQPLYGCYRVCMVDGQILLVFSHCLPMAIRALNITCQRDKKKVPAASHTEQKNRQPQNTNRPGPIPKYFNIHRDPLAMSRMAIPEEAFSAGQVGEKVQLNSHRLGPSSRKWIEMPTSKNPQMRRRTQQNPPSRRRIEGEALGRLAAATKRPKFPRCMSTDGN